MTRDQEVRAAKNAASVQALAAAEAECTRTAGTAEHAEAVRKYQRAAALFGPQHAARIGLLKFGDPRRFETREIGE